MSTKLPDPIEAAERIQAFIDARSTARAIDLDEILGHNGVPLLTADLQAVLDALRAKAGR